MSNIVFSYLLFFNFILKDCIFWVTKVVMMAKSTISEVYLPSNVISIAKANWIVFEFENFDTISFVWCS